MIADSHHKFHNNFAYHLLVKSINNDTVSPRFVNDGIENGVNKP